MIFFENMISSRTAKPDRKKQMLRTAILRKYYRCRRAAPCPYRMQSALPRNAREGALITVDSFVGRGAHWCYWSTDAAAQLPMAAVLCWLGDFLAGTERRTLQSCTEAVQLAAQWQADLASPFACPVDRLPQPMAPAAPAAARRASAQPVQNPRWQSILAVLATV